MRECPETGCYCEFVTFKPCPHCQIHGNKNVLTKEEQAICETYIRLISSDKKIPNEIVLKINQMYEKYPDFCL